MTSVNEMMKKVTPQEDQISEQEEFKPVLYSSPNFPFIKCQLSTKEIQFDRGAWCANTPEDYKLMEQFLTENPQHRATVQKVDMRSAEQIARNYLEKEQKNTIGRGPLTSQMMSDARSPAASLQAANELAHAGMQQDPSKPAFVMPVMQSGTPPVVE